MKISEKIFKWREKGKHLPKFLRDFHDQKEIFKMIHELTITDKGDISWVQGHIYVIDTFLWCMARFGYTLQKTRSKLPFEALKDTLAYCENKRINLLKSVFNPPDNPK